MISYPIPTDEPERLQLLQALAVLDTPPEPALDRITRMVASLLDVPIALVSLVDAERQWFKSKVGITENQTPRDVAFCAHTIMQSVPLIVSDATMDARFCDNPLVTAAPNIRFYAGVPIRSSGGLALGTLCAIDMKPRTLSPDQVTLLTDLADMVSREMQFRETMMLTRAQLNHSEDILDAAEARFRTVFERADVGIAMVAPDGGWISVNDALCDIVGYSHDELTRMTFQDITYPEDLDTDLNLINQLMSGEIDRYQLDKRYVRKDGKLIWIQLNVTKQTNERGELQYFVSIIKDIQARKEAEASLAELRRDLERRVKDRTQELRSANEMLASVLEQQLQADQALRKRETELRMVIENANDAYICMGSSGLVTAWNQQAEITFGWKAEDAIGRRLDELIIPPAMQERHREAMQHYVLTGQSTMIGHRIELPAMRRDGTVIPVEIRIQALKLQDELIFSAFLHDISTRKHAEELREQEARRDALTGLPNRRAFFEILPQAIARGRRNRAALALLFIDLDGFKAVNDMQGHKAGDALLCEIGQRFMQLLRQTDTVARLAGDEFVILLENLDIRSPAAEQIAGKILASIQQPVVLEQGPVHVSASIGIAVHLPDDQTDTDTLLNRADGAMYAAKRAGKSRVVLAAN